MSGKISFFFDIPAKCAIIAIEITETTETTETQRPSMLVDFDNIPTEHETMIHVPFHAKTTYLLDALYQEKVLDAMEVRIKPPFTCCTVERNGIAKVPTQLCIVFANRSHSGNSEALCGLWRVLHANNLQVIWKCLMHGYTIGPDFKILDSWELDDGMC